MRKSVVASPSARPLSCSTRVSRTRRAASGLTSLVVLGLTVPGALGFAGYVVRSGLTNGPRAMAPIVSEPMRAGPVYPVLANAAPYPSPEEIMLAEAARAVKVTVTDVSPPLVEAPVWVSVPMPPRRPAMPAVAAAPSTQQLALTTPLPTAKKDAEPEVTGSLPPVEKAPVKPAPVTQPQLAMRSPVTPPPSPFMTDRDSRVAVYDITRGVVHMPNGTKLEAHSGLGAKMDDPRHVNVRMWGATPPNIYDLKLRETLFHGVQAIRLNPVDERKMFGRDGILAHTYMLGPSGQSNGCVSFKDYRAFLNAFLRGEVNRILVVEAVGNTSLAQLRAGAARREQYASAER